MASFRRRNGKWQVQIRRTSEIAVSRTFTRRHDAALWATLVEANIETQGLPISQKRGKTTLCELLDRYETDVIPMKRADSSERYMLRVIRRYPMATKPITLLTAQDLAQFRDERLKRVKASTVTRQLRLLKHALRIAADEWGWAVPLGEVKKLRMPQVVIRHTDRVDPSEFDELLRAARQQANPAISTALRLALSTGMRRGELLALRWDDVNLGDRQLLVRTSKNGRPRVIPLTGEAIAILDGIEPKSGAVIPISANCLKLAFARARKRAKTRFRFHDLRHEAISRFFELGLTIPEVQLISGHRTLSQLSRYTHPDVARVKSKLMIPSRL